MTIRPATDPDVEDIVAMGLTFAATVYAGRVPQNGPHMAATVRALLGRDDAHILVAEDRGGAVVGMLGVFAQVHPFRGDVVLTELFWWVEPHARGIGLRLLRQAEQWGRARGAEVLQIVAPSRETAQLYQRLGFEWLETIYQRRIA